MDMHVIAQGIGRLAATMDFSLLPLDTQSASDLYTPPRLQNPVIIPKGSQVRYKAYTSDRSTSGDPVEVVLYYKQKDRVFSTVFQFDTVSEFQEEFQGYFL